MFTLFVEQEVDGGTFLKLSSCRISDIERQLECKFTFGGKTKLEELMASFCKRPSISGKCSDNFLMYSDNDQLRYQMLTVG